MKTTHTTPPHVSNPTSSDVLIFNQNPFPRILGILPLALGIVSAYLVYSGEHPFIPFGVLSISLLLSVGYAFLTQVQELRIDFSQRAYQLRVGSSWHPTIATGTLSDIDHLRLGIGHHSGRDGPYSYVYLELLWRDIPQGWPPKLMKFDGPGEGFQLKAVRFDVSEGSRTNAKQEMEAYAASLAARLQCPVLDDTADEN